MYLIFPTEQEATDRADVEGKKQNFAYWTKGRGTRWLTKPAPTEDGLWALDVSEYALDDLEKTTAVESVVLPEPEE
tara:strand:+ start:257 stop:484 length:228 start_codon:yes stop_codon:yes gene_type:complete